MKAAFRSRLLVLLPALLLAAAATAGQDVNSQIKAETEQLRQQLHNKKPADSPEIVTEIDNYLKKSDEAIAAGHLYTALESLAVAKNLYGGFAEGRELTEAQKKDLPTFEQRWNKANLELTALDEKAKSSKWDNSPAIIRALSQAAEAQTMPFLEGGRAFAGATGAESGLFYVGQARASADWVLFLHSLHANTGKSSFPARSILPELYELQNRTNAAYTPPRSIDKHTDFIRLNSALKMTGELDSGKLYFGAWYRYLGALLQFQLLDAPAVDASRQAQLAQQVTKWRDKLTSSPRDDSIALLFVQRAEDILSQAKPSAEDYRKIVAVVDHVLPSYEKMLASAPKLQKNGEPLVTITLVRWPYT